MRGPVSIQKNTLLLVRLDGIGDYVLFRNFIKSLSASERYRGYRLTLCANHAYKDLAETLDSDFVSDFIWLNQDALVNQVSYRKKWLSVIRARGFEVVIHPTFSRDYFSGDSVVKASGSHIRIGSQGDYYNTPRWLSRLSNQFYTFLIPVNSTLCFEFERNKTFFEHLLGAKFLESLPHIEFTNATQPFTKPTLILFPGAGLPSNRWPLESYIKCGEALQTRYGLHVIIAGDSHTLHSIRAFFKKYPHPFSQSLVTTRSLTELTHFIAGSTLLICNDTGAAHIGAALKKPTLCVSRGNNTVRFHPYPPGDHSFRVIYPEGIRLPANISCITSEKVVLLAEEILSQLGY